MLENDECHYNILSLNRRSNVCAFASTRLSKLRRGGHTVCDKR